MRGICAVDQFWTKVTPADYQNIGSGGVRMLIVTFRQGRLSRHANEKLLLSACLRHFPSFLSTFA